MSHASPGNRIIGAGHRYQRHQPENTPLYPIDNIDTPTAPLTWAQRLQRVFEIHITLCPHCGGQLRVNRRLIAEQSA